MTKRKKILVADLLCGAGGSSTGCKQALDELGLDMELVCVNHWGVALDTHKRNHPAARHYCEDIAAVRPHIVVPEGYLDLLMASPSCTHHSVARGGKPTSDQQRSDPWHILTWFTELRVRRAIIENVWEFCQWGPVDPKTGKPIKSRKGEYFNAWVSAIRALGATSIEYRKLNAADYGDATTRQRFIMIIRFDGKAIAWPQPTHMQRPNDGLSLFPTMKPWRPAREIIDWGIKGRSIFNRKKPLAPKTLARIYAGAVKFKWPEPFLIALRKHMEVAAGLRPVPIVPYIAELEVEGLDLHPVILSQHNSGAPRSTDDPLPTITTGGASAETHPGCARPMVAEPVIINGRKGNQAKGVSTEQVPTLDTKGGVWLAEPFIATVAHGNQARETEPDGRRCRPLDDPLQTIHAGGGKFAVVEPFILSQASCGAPRGVSDPAPTIVAGKKGSGTALIAPYYGSGSGETCSSEAEPLPTVTAKPRFGMVLPVTHSDGSHRARDVEESPLATITTANRGELAFIAASFGEREGQAPRVHSIEEPAPTICATGRVNVVEPTEGYDILFRMLEPHELAAAMGFDGYEFAGTKTDQVKQIGNAVSVKKMKACVKAVMADAVPRRKAEPGAAESEAA